MVSSLISPVLSPPAGSSANPSPQGFREPAPAPCAFPPRLSNVQCVLTNPAMVRSGSERRGQDGTLWEAWGYPFVNSWQSPGRGHACDVPQTFHHCRAVGGREVGHPARGLGGPQEAATEHVPNTPALPHRQTGRLRSFLEHSAAFCHVSRPN